MSRIFGDVFPHATWRKYSKQTTNNTKTTISTIALAEGDTCFVLAKAYGVNADVDKVFTYMIGATFYRAVGGNVTQEGATQDIYGDGTAGLTVAFDAEVDVTNQTIDINITGETSETYDWIVEVQENMIVRPS
ncbi:hypothetical protein LCGC14_2721790 [marine sediment metagenome]|uniref:Uncharacterized protein n=1 Tax=marine sediment metagenome TaxID=412755 RepID=A0A0F8ZXJ4_9ZZZZ